MVFVYFFVLVVEANGQVLLDQRLGEDFSINRAGGWENFVMRESLDSLVGVSETCAFFLFVFLGELTRVFKMVN